MDLKKGDKVYRVTEYQAHHLQDDPPPYEIVERTIRSIAKTIRLDKYLPGSWRKVFELHHVGHIIHATKEAALKHFIIEQNSEMDAADRLREKASAAKRWAEDQLRWLSEASATKVAP